MSKIGQSWLIQQLQAPVGTGRMAAISEAFSFGGGYTNGGLTKNAMELLRPIFSFNYMGAAEYEWGAVPEGLSKIAKAADKKALDAWESSTEGVYVLAPREWRDEIETRIAGWATRSGPKIRDSTMLDLVLGPDEGYKPRVCGWLELDNGFLFFTDPAMWAQTSALFGVKVPEEVRDAA